MRPDREFSYDPIADAYAETIDEAPYNKHYERPAMLELLPPLNGKRILEAGCGAGWYTEQLLRRGARVSAVDASERIVEHARRRIDALEPEERARAELRAADLRAPLPFESGSFDGIVSALVFHYLRDWNTMLREFRRVLAPGGWLLFSTHHPCADATRLKPGESYFDVVQEEDTWKRCGKVLFFRRSLTAISDALAAAGLGIVRLVEPRPTDEFRAAKPDSYDRLMQMPEFLIVIARPW